MARNKEGQRRYYAEYYQANRARIRAQQSAYRVANRSKIAGAAYLRSHSERSR